MAGGLKNFGPTYKSTNALRLGYEGTLNGAHPLDGAVIAAQPDGELAGKFAGMGAGGVKLAAAGGADAVGLFREDLGDMVNASLNATFYFRGGEYYVAEERLGAAAATFVVGDQITSDADGKIVKAAAADRALGTVVFVGEYKAGNMYEWAGTTANGGKFLGFILHM